MPQLWGIHWRLRCFSSSILRWSGFMQTCFLTFWWWLIDWLASWSCGMAWNHWRTLSEQWAAFGSLWAPLEMSSSLSDRWVGHFIWSWGVEPVDQAFSRACFLSLGQSKLRLCSANHRAGYFSNLACDCLSLLRARDRKRGQLGDPWKFWTGCLFI